MVLWRHVPLDFIQAQRSGTKLAGVTSTSRIADIIKSAQECNNKPYKNRRTVPTTLEVEKMTQNMIEGL